MSAGSLATVVVPGRPATELSDEELESQGTRAHATRNWVFLHGTAEQFARHTSRMLELEQEYLRRHPHRTWQGSGGAPTGHGDEAAALREALRGIVRQLDALAAEPLHDAPPAVPTADPSLRVLAAVAAAGGRMHKLEVHQAAREARLDRAGLAALYTATDPWLAADQQDRLLTPAGRERLRRAGWASGAAPDRAAAPSWAWRQQERAVWDEDKQRVIGGAPAGVFDLAHRAGESLPGDWWAAVDEASGRVVGFGWMDVTWGEAEILLAVEPDAQQTGLGSFVLDHLESEAASRGLNYVYNTVRDTHPRHDEVADWLGVRGYRGDADDGALRKRVQGPGAPSVGAAAGPAARATAGPAVHATGGGGARPGADLGPGREDSGGYVDVDDHSY